MKDKFKWKQTWFFSLTQVPFKNHSLCLRWHNCVYCCICDMQWVKVITDFEYFDSFLFVYWFRFGQQLTICRKRFCNFGFVRSRGNGKEEETHTHTHESVYMAHGLIISIGCLRLFCLDYNICKLSMGTFSIEKLLRLACQMHWTVSMFLKKTPETTNNDK